LVDLFRKRREEWRGYQRGLIRKEKDSGTGTSAASDDIGNDIGNDDDDNEGNGKRGTKKKKEKKKEKDEIDFIFG